ncbi:hypothetical protein [Afipia felis]
MIGFVMRGLDPRIHHFTTMLKRFGLLKRFGFKRNHPLVMPGFMLA